MSGDCAPAELVAVTMARALRDREVVVMGAVPTIPLAACRLAQTLHAPTLSYIVGGSGTVNPTPAALPTQSCRTRSSRARAPPLPDVAPRGRGDVLDVLLRRRAPDRRPRYRNLVCAGTSARSWPGSVGLPFLSAVGRTIIYTLPSNRRTFVERVDFVSGAGDRAELVVTASGRWTSTPRAGGCASPRPIRACAWTMS
jgi:glutaconate CoA-transferase subunit B